MKRSETRDRESTRDPGVAIKIPTELADRCRILVRRMTQTGAPELAPVKTPWTAAARAALVIGLDQLEVRYPKAAQAAMEPV